MFHNCFLCESSPACTTNISENNCLAEALASLTPVIHFVERVDRDEQTFGHFKKILKQEKVLVVQYYHAYFVPLLF